MSFDKISRRTIIPVVLLTFTLFAGCGGGESDTSGPPPLPVNVVVTPSTQAMDQGATTQFSASVFGTTNRAVTWAIQEGSAGGSIGRTGLYTAPTREFTAHVVATSVADPSKFAVAQVTTRAISVFLPSAVAVRPGHDRQFTASVMGTVVKEVNWTIDEGFAGGTISSNGLYSAPMSGGPFHVTAHSVADSSRAASTVVVVTDAGLRTLSSSTLQPRLAHTATLLPNGKVLIAGGVSCDLHSERCDGPLLSSAELFDPATETFSATGSMSIARRNHTATLLNDGTVLVTGGLNSGNASDATAEIYDPATGGFTRVGEMSDAFGRFGHTASLIGDGRVLIAGGVQGEGAGFNGSTKTAELYDPATKTFSPVGNMPQEVGFHTANVLLDGTVLIVGGEGNSCPISQRVATFDPAGKSFISGVSLPEARVGHTATALNDGRILITGGADPCDFFGTIWDTAVVFDPATKRFSPEKAMSEARFGHSATLLPDGKVLIVGFTAELFDPATSSFTIINGPDVLSPGRLATRLADGRVLFTGYAAAAEIYE